MVQTSAITTSPVVSYLINFTTSGTYTVWLRGYASNAAGDSAYVGLNGQLVSVTGFAPGQWRWARLTTSGLTATLTVTSSGLSTVTLWMREDGSRIDRLLITTNTTYIPTGFGPTESPRVTASSPLTTPLTHTIVYTYDQLYRLTNANYSTGETYAYSYDPVGNRLQQIINGDTTDYLYDAANRLASVDGQAYTFDNNGNLLTTGALTNTWDAANRLVSAQRATTTLQPIYNGVGDRVAQTVGTTTTNFALDVAGGLPEVIYTSEGNAYLHLPGVIMAESATGEVRYLLSDGLGSVRQAVDETGAVVAYNEFDPYGNPVENGSEVYGFTGEWWENEVGLLHLRARWYLPYLNQFISPDPIIPDYFHPQSLNQYSYVRNNPVNFVDPLGFFRCDPLTGQCEAGYGLCVVQGIWQGAYVNGKPCIVNPNNVQTGNGPNWPSPPQFTGWLPQPSLPTVGTPTTLPPPTPPSPGGLTGVGQAIINSHLTQETDGFVVGGSLAANFIALLGVSDPLVGYLNGRCVPGTGGTFGLEVVYDFKHQERGLFEYHGGVLNFLGVGNAGGTSYMGLTRGFATQGSANDPTGYRTGVGAYGGYFASMDVSVTPFELPIPFMPSPSGGGIFIEAAPLLEPSRNLNSQGVFATYVGVTGGGGMTIPYVSGDIAVTYYTLLFGGNWPGRVRYALPFGTSGLNNDQIIERQRSIPRRMAAAAVMTNEINVLGGSAANPITSFAINKLWSWALRP